MKWKYRKKLFFFTYEFWNIKKNYEMWKFYLTLEIFSCCWDVGHDVGDDAQDGCERDQAHDQLKYHIKVLRPKIKIK
jgi:hypothetical protein